MQQENRAGKESDWGLGIGAGEGLSAEQDPVLLCVFMHPGQHRARSHCWPTALAEQAKFGDSCSGDECITARGKSYR